MKRKSSLSTSPAASGNPAYPSLQAREKLVAENKKHPEVVKKIPADALKKPVTPPAFPSR